MSRLAQTATVSTTQEVVLEPKLRKRLQLKLQEYAKIHAQIAPLKAKLKALTQELGAVRDETGEMSVALEGYGIVTLVAGTYKKFNEKLFVRIGGDLGLYKEALEEKPKKAYNKITLPGGSDDEDDWS
jgi:hypothetical protein